MDIHNSQQSWISTIPSWSPITTLWISTILSYNVYTSSYYHHQIGSMNYYPLIRVRSWNKDMRCMSFYILMNLWYCRIASDNGWIMSWWHLPRIWPSVTDMQHYCHARYPTDDWHLAYMFLPVYFSVEVCLEGVVPHSDSTRRDPCVKVYAPLTLALPLARKQIRTGVTRLSTCIKRGGHLNRHMGLPALLGDNLGCWIV